MANYTAADVKKLREETDAPMMECKAALDEADGNYDRAKEILREKGKAAAAKRAGRSTAAGVVAFAMSADNKTVGGVVVESETDFVARNDEFIALSQQLAELVRDDANVDAAKLKELTDGAVAKMREHIHVTRFVRVSGDKAILTYIHHDRTKGALVVVEGPATEEVRKVAIQAVAFPAEVLAKEDLSQEKIDAEIAIETKRAMDEGKPENIAKNIATGRVNKEYVKRAALLEQPYYIDPAKSVAQHLAESAKDSKVVSFEYLAVGQ